MHQVISGDERRNFSVGWQVWCAYLAMCFGMFMAILDIQVVASSMPEIQSGLHIDDDRLSWIQTSYLIAEIIAIPLAGWLTHLLSLRRLFVVAVSGFTLASIGCAESSGFATMIACRLVQGFCGGSIIPAVFTSAILLFPQRLHGVVTAIGGVTAMLAPTLGPAMAGWITENYSWRWIFLINVVPGILVSCATFRLLRREPADWGRLKRLDYLTLFQLATFLGSLEIALDRGARAGWGDPVVLCLMLTCVVAGVGCIRRSLCCSWPLVELRCYRTPVFVVGNVFSFVLGFGLYGSIFLLALDLGVVRDHSPLETGMIMMTAGVAQLIVAPVAALLGKWVDARLIVGLGYALFGAGLLLSGTAPSFVDAALAMGPHADDDVFWPQVLRGAGTMLCLLPTTTLSLESQPPSRAADASGLFNLMRNLGGAIGIAMVSSIVFHDAPLYGQQLAEGLRQKQPETAAAIGLPLQALTEPENPLFAASDRAAIDHKVRYAAMAMSMDEAWRVMGIPFFAALLLLPWLRPYRAETNLAAPMVALAAANPPPPRFAPAAVARRSVAAQGRRHWVRRRDR